MPGIERPRPNPIDDARNKFRETLQRRQYSASVLTGSVDSLRDVLVSSTNPPVEIFRELSTAAGLAADIALGRRDQVTAHLLRNTSERYGQAADALAAQASEESVQPTETTSLPEMTSAKGE